MEGNSKKMGGKTSKKMGGKPPKGWRLKRG